LQENEEANMTKLKDSLNEYLVIQQKFAKGIGDLIDLQKKSVELYVKTKEKNEYLVIQQKMAKGMGDLIDFQKKSAELYVKVMEEIIKSMKEIILFLEWG
jgi:hypothetical protein